MPVLTYRSTGQIPGLPVVMLPARPDPRPAGAAWHGFVRAHTKIGPRIAVAVQDVWPARVLVTVTDLNTADNVVVYREVAGERTAVRAGELLSATDPSFLVLDAELPFGVEVTYIAVVDGNDIVADPLTVTLVGGNVALSDAVSGVAAEVVITAWPEKAKQRRSTVFTVGGRNVVVAALRGGFSGAIDVYTETETARLSVDELLEGATSGVIQLRQSGGYYGVDAYVAVLSDTEKRWSQDGSDERRIWTLDVVEVEAWASSLEASGFTLEDLDTYFTGQSLAEIAAAYTTLLEISQADLSD